MGKVDLGYIDVQESCQSLPAAMSQGHKTLKELSIVQSRGRLRVKKKMQGVEAHKKHKNPYVHNDAENVCSKYDTTWEVFLLKQINCNQIKPLDLPVQRKVRGGMLKKMQSPNPEGRKIYKANSQLAQ